MPRPNDIEQWQGGEVSEEEVRVWNACNRRWEKWIDSLPDNMTIKELKGEL